MSKMLGEVTSKELSEWQAYFSIKEEQAEAHEEEAAAKKRAKDNNR